MLYQLVKSGQRGSHIVEKWSRMVNGYSDSVGVGIVLHLVQDRAELPSGMDVVVCVQCTRCRWYYRAWRR